jgi:hypothetical protein
VLPAWLTRDGDCLVVTPDSFTGATKAEANAAAQAALDAYVAAGLTSGEIVCQDGQGCIPPFYERQQFTDTLTDTDDVSAFETIYGDHYCKNYSLAVTAGKSFSAFLNADFDTVLIFIDPDGQMVARDEFAGYYVSGGNSSAITYYPNKTGVYTVQVTTHDPTATGAYDLVILDGPTKTFDPISAVFAGIYVPSTKRIFFTSSWSSLEAYAYTIDAQTELVINSVLLQTLPGTYADSGQPFLFYNPNDDSVWAATRNPVSLTDRDIFRLHPSTGAIIESFTIAIGCTYFPAYVPSVNKIFGNEGIGIKTEINVFNCATRSYETPIPLAVPTVGKTYCKYIPELDSVIVFKTDSYQLINPNTLVSGGHIASDGIDYYGFYLDGLYYTTKRSGSKNMHKVDLASGAITDIVATNYFLDGFYYNPCRDRVVAAFENSKRLGEIANFDLDFTLTETWVPITETSGVSISNKGIMVWNPDSFRMYVCLDTDPLSFVGFGDTTTIFTIY